MKKKLFLLLLLLQSKYIYLLTMTLKSREGKKVAPYPVKRKKKVFLLLVSFLTRLIFSSICGE